MRFSFASFTLQPPLRQTSPSPWPPAFPLPLHPLEEEGGPIKRHIREFGYYERAPSARRILVQFPLLFNFVDKGSDARPSQFDLGASRSACDSITLARGAMHIKRYIVIYTEFSFIWGEWPLLSKGLRGGKERSDRVVSLLRHMLQSARSKSATKRSLSEKGSVSGKAPNPEGVQMRSSALRWCNVFQIRFQAKPRKYGLHSHRSQSLRVYGLISVGSGLVSNLNSRIYRLNGPSSRKG